LNSSTFAMYDVARVGDPDEERIRKFFGWERRSPDPGRDVLDT